MKGIQKDQVPAADWEAPIRDAGQHAIVDSPSNVRFPIIYIYIYDIYIIYIYTVLYMKMFLQFYIVKAHQKNAGPRARRQTCRNWFLFLAAEGSQQRGRGGQNVALW